MTKAIETLTAIGIGILVGFFIFKALEILDSLPPHTPLPIKSR